MSTESKPDVRIRPAVSGLFATRALLPSGWATDVRLDWGRDGRLTTVEVGSDPAQAARDGLPMKSGAVLPGRVMVGARSGRPFETAGAASGPAALEQWAMAAMVGLLEAGFTSVCEIHACHSLADPAHPAGLASDARWAMSLAHAAAEAGIGLTLLPAWSWPGVGSAASTASRHIEAVDRLLGLLAGLKPQCDPLGVRVGLCVLVEEKQGGEDQRRPSEALVHLLGGLDALDRDAPVHWLGPLPEGSHGVLEGRRVCRLPVGLEAGRLPAGPADGPDLADQVVQYATWAGRPVAGLALGQQADLVCVDACGGIDEVWTAGRPAVTAGRHDLHDRAQAARSAVLGRQRPSP